ncbi:MAG: sugar ABC transporter permease [Ruminococcus sp.]|nr:sugar ABC transporter permease [Ruminococcus sp.]
MKYIDYMQLNPFQRFGFKFVEFFRLLPKRIKDFFCFIGRSIKNFFVGIGRFIADYFMGFIHGDIFTKLSYIFMGVGNIAKGQVVKGIAFFILEALYIVFMVFFGGGAIVNLIGLVAVYNQIPIAGPGNRFNDVLIFNSTQNLLFGILAVMATIAFIAIYFVSIKSALNCERIKRNGGKPMNFKQESMELLNSRFHTTLLTLPIILISVFVLLPLIFMIAMAFTNFGMGAGTIESFKWVGLRNFENIFSISSDGGASMGETFLKVAGWTLVWAVFATFSNYILGMVVALMINKKGIKLKKLWRTLFVMTIAVPQFVTLLLMSQMLKPDSESAFNIIASWLGAAEPINLWSSANDGLLARITVIVVNCWVGIPYTILMTSGILMNIPEDLYESARIDGAGPVKSFVKITLPYMLFVTTPYLITTFIGNVNNFNVIFLLSQGNPKVNEYKYGAGKTDLMITLLYKLSIDQNKYGLGAAIGILVFIICATLSLVTFNMTKSAKNEEEFS